MQVENATLLTKINPLQFQDRRHVIADDVENTSISFRILNKHHRVRLSSNEFDYSNFPRKTNLFAVSNSKGCFVAAIKQQNDFCLICSSLRDLRSSFKSGQSSSSPFIPIQSQSSHTKLSGTPCNVRIAMNDERLLVGIMDGSVIVYDLNQLFGNESQSDPSFVIPARFPTPVADILPNRGENSELVAILHGPINEKQGYQVEIFDLKKRSSLITWHGGEDPSLIPISISWSPKGKQIAIGLQSGDILLFNPHDPIVPKNYILKSPSITDSSSCLLSISWLATNKFYLVFSSSESCFPSFDRESTRDVSKAHVILVYEPKNRTALDIEVSEPSPPFGASFPPGPLCCVIKDWLPINYLLICGDGPSSDIGVLGSTSDKNWNHYTFEETSTPTLPLGEGAEDMVLLGLDVDLTSDEPVRISEQPDDGTPDLPPSPILYAYTSDGSVVAWHILYLNGTPFPGMVRSTQAISDSIMSSIPVSGPEQQVSKGIPLSEDVAQTSVIAPAKGFGVVMNQQPSIFGSTNTGSETTSTFGLPASGTQSATQAGSGFGNRPPAPTFGVSGWGFGSKPMGSTFGTVGVGNKGEISAAPVVAQSGFTSFASNPSKPASVFSGGGFAAFAQTGASSFGSPLGTTKTSIFDQPSDSSAQFTTTSPKSVFGAGGVGLTPSAGSQKSSISSVKTADVSMPSSDFGSRSTDNTSTSSSFGTKSAVPGTISAFKPSDINTLDSGTFSTLGVRALDTMSSLAGSLDATAGSPPGSPSSVEETPPNSPPPQSTDLPKPMSSYIKPATAFGAPSAIFSESKPTSPFVKPGFGAFGSSTESSTATSPFKPATDFGRLPENTVEIKPAASAFTAAKSTQSTTSVFGVRGFSQAAKASASSEPSTPVSGGFGAFAGGGFASFAKPHRASSFDELLNQGDLRPTKSPLVFGPSSKSESPNSDGGLTGKLAVTRAENTEKDKKGDGDEKKNTLVAKGGITGNSFSLATLNEAVEIAVTIEKDSSTIRERPVVEEVKSPIQQIEEVKTEPPFTKTASEQEKVAEVTKPIQSPVSKAPELSTPVLAPQPVTPSIAAATEFAIPGASSVSVVGGGGAEKPASSLFAPKPTLSPTPQAPSAVAIGLGRPSSRPARSSPLAGAPITLGESAITVAPQENPTPPSHAPALSVPSSHPGLSSRKPLDLGNNASKVAEISKPSVFKAPVPVPLPSKSPNVVVTPSPFFIPMKSEEQLIPKEAPVSDQHPLQLEFIRIYEDFCSELKDLEKGLQALKALFPVIQVPRGLDKLVPNKDEFVPGKYSFGDLTPFKILISRLHEKVLPLLDEGKSGKFRLTELQNLTLISETRLEELSRWATAKEDPGFAKTLKPKSLGPEHTENQLRLRKLLQNTLSRLQQCEDIIEALQKKLNQEKKGSAGFQAPTLDTIDRTCRNIKVALDERTDIADKLSERVEALSPCRKARSPVIGMSLSPPSPAPAANIAIAALNSERLCLSLKNALFNARQRPLFTDSVTRAPSAAKSFDPDTTPIFEKGFSSPLYNNIITAPDSGSDSFLNSHESADRRRQSRKHTSIAVPFKNNIGEEAKASTSFSWGPLPKIVSTPPKKLPFEFKTSAKDATLTE